MRKCRKCYQPVADDGYGEPVHADTNKYQCDPADKANLDVAS